MESEVIQYARLDADGLAANARWWEIYEECFPLAQEREQTIAIIESVRKMVRAGSRPNASSGEIPLEQTNARDGVQYVAIAGGGGANFRGLPPT